jgi:hypothetical protein
MMNSNKSVAWWLCLACGIVLGLSILAIGDASAQPVGVDVLSKLHAEAEAEHVKGNLEGCVAKASAGEGQARDSSATYARLFRELKENCRKELEGKASRGSVVAIPSFPVGTVIAFAGPKDRIPPGWLLCDGNPYPVAKYQDLFDVIGHMYGDVRESGMFAVPDFRGRFLRGLNHDAVGVGRDPEGKDRVLGKIQEVGTAMPKATFKAEGGAHEHPVDIGAAWDCGDGKPRFALLSNRCSEFVPGEFSGGTNNRPGKLPKNGSHHHDILGGDVETRPVNFAVNYIIFAGISRSRVR